MTTPFSRFVSADREQSPFRRAITAAYRRPEAECLAPLLKQATLTAEAKVAVQETARELITALRAKPVDRGIGGLVREFPLSSEEGTALMCLAEALLRIPDRPTRDALIREKIAHRNWRSRIGSGSSLFANAAIYGLTVTARLLESADERGLSAALSRLMLRAGEPMIRRTVERSMRMMGKHFVTGETIGEALNRARKQQAQGFTCSYDMLGEAAITAADAARYYRQYENAIHAIGKASDGRGIYEGPGISIKLSALHPRYSRAQFDRVMSELLPNVKALAALAKSYGIGLTIDAEEADRLELSLDLLESLALDPELSGWNGLGFAVQAYGKRCPFVIDWIIDLARRADRRIMVRLVKGAYWDAEIKRAQIDGLSGFPVYTRKVHTDVAYMACARKLLTATDSVFPQFATHNAHTVAAIHEMAGPDFAIGKYEFQCLHGMGEPLYEEVVGGDRLNRPCRIYAPVGTYETLLAYLVRRLLENGANSSFVNRIADPEVPIEALIADPVEQGMAMPVPGAGHEAIMLPADIYPGRRNSSGIDLTDEMALDGLSKGLADSAKRNWQAVPAIPGPAIERMSRPVKNPADHRDLVGTVAFALEQDAVHAARVAAIAASGWAVKPVAERAAMLERAADAMQARMPILVGLIVREAGKSIPNAIAEVREAVDFLRYYAAEAHTLHDAAPLGPVVCISPWNFPLAIFTGQIAAALAAGNPVLAKPAEETPLIAAESVAILHEAGVPADVLQYIPGGGPIGAALVGAPETMGVMFTGSTEVARLIQKQLAERFSPEGRPIPLIAETGGQNAMIVDSSALTEQVVADVIVSAFDSAGQRCSALRILCLQDEIADRTLSMLKGALQELRIGNPDRLAVDIGPVITAEAKTNIEKHIEAMKAKGHRVEQQHMPCEVRYGTFVPPTIILLDDLAELKQEVFGPVLHVIRYQRAGLDGLIDAINATGYGLTFGLHSRSDEMIDHVTSRVKAGNFYINRNVIGAVVGVQPFGGRGLSGTGPKAGGPLYLKRLVQVPPKTVRGTTPIDPALADFIGWLLGRADGEVTADARRQAEHSAVGLAIELPGPVGERNLYALHPRGRILMKPETTTGLYRQIAAVLAAGCDGVIEGMALPAGLPTSVTARLSTRADGDYAGALVEGEGARIAAALRHLAALPGRIVVAHTPGTDGYHVDWLLDETSISINSAAAGGNASLMSVG